MGFMGAASTAAANELAHTLTFAINLAIFTNMCQFIYHSSKRKQSSDVSNWLPFYLMVIATVLVMVDLLRHVLQDSHSFYLEDSNHGRYSIHVDECTYVVTQPTGPTCSQSGLGPLTIGEVSAVNMTGWSMYNEDGSLSSVGWFITVGCTWSGMLLMMTSILLSLRKKSSSTSSSSSSSVPLLA